MQKGPCIICGATDYPLSYGGPTICPSCDCGNYNTTHLVRRNADLRATVQQQAQEIERLKNTISDMGMQYRSEFATLVNERDSLRQQLEAANGEIERLKYAVSMNRGYEKRRDKEADNDTEIIKQLTTRIATLESALREIVEAAKSSCASSCGARGPYVACLITEIAQQALKGGAQ